jgi:hypothetical protein
MPDRAIDEQLRTSQFVVAGSVAKVGATTMPIDPTVPNVGVFKIDEILHGPKELGGFAGREITVVFRDSGNVDAGDRLVLFATSWLYGDSLVVLEVGRMEDRERTAMRKELDEARQRLVDERLRVRIDLAQLVIVGKVAKTTPAPKYQGRTPITEHDPDWWEAVIKLESVEKGQHEGPATILFPKSVDVAWSQSPKFQPGQDGVWILQRDQKERGWPVLRRPGLTALDPLDYQPRSELNRIRGFLTRKR